MALPGTEAAEPHDSPAQVHARQAQAPGALWRVPFVLFIKLIISHLYNLGRQALELEPAAAEDERSSSLAADLNREAHDAALGLVADAARQRYEARGRRLRFPPDRRAPGGTRCREPRGHPAAVSHACSCLPALCARRARTQGAPSCSPVAAGAGSAACGARPLAFLRLQARARRRARPAEAAATGLHAAPRPARAATSLQTQSQHARLGPASPQRGAVTEAHCQLHPGAAEPRPRLALQGRDARGRHAGAVGGGAPLESGRKRARACRGAHSPASACGVFGSTPFSRLASEARGAPGNPQLAPRPLGLARAGQDGSQAGAARCVVAWTCRDVWPPCVTRRPADGPSRARAGVQPGAARAGGRGRARRALCWRALHQVPVPGGAGGVHHVRQPAPVTSTREPGRGGGCY